MKLTPQEAMSLAIQEGEKGAGFVSPNPCVGCVILDSTGNLIGRGYHERYGEAHAEINALNSIPNKERLRGAHVFVTLEPCAHEGKTGSCAKALAQLPISSVTYGLRDPFPQVNGKGVEILRQAGKSVERFSGLQEQLEELCEIFLHNVNTGLPFVAVKVAASLDGQIALKNGESQWITGPESRDHVQYLRGCFDAVLAGANTFLKDNPRLNSRDPRFTQKKSKVVILDAKGEAAAVLKGSALLSVRDAREVFLLTGNPVRTDATNIVLPLNSQGNFDLRSILTALKSQNVNSIFVEGGAFTVSQLFKQRQVQRIYVFLAPKILGSGLSWTHDLRLEKLDDGIVLDRVRTRQFGSDIFVTGRIQA